MATSDNMTNVQRIKFGVDHVLDGGPSMRNGESLQTQIALAPERALNAPLIKGWPDGKGGTYNTSPLQQLVYMTQALARTEAKLAVIEGMLGQIAQAANKGVAVQIDYDRIEQMMPKLPEYELTPKKEN